MSTAVSIISNQIYAIRNDFDAVLIDRSINFEREAGFAIQAITANDYSIGVAQKNPQSVINAVTNIAAIGISLNPAKKQAYLVPRDGKICLDISYMGLMDLAIETGSIKWAQAALVHENDTFALSGFDKPPHHQYSPFSNARGKIIGVYVVVKTADGDYLNHSMSLEAVYDIRDRSAAWKAWKEKQKKCPWVTDEGEMIKKTCVKQAYKYWPKTERLEEAIHHLNTEGDEGIDITPEKPRCAPEVLKSWIDQAKAATTTEQILKVWRDGVATIRATKDVAAYEEFKDVVAIRGAEIKIQSAPIEGEVVAESQADPQGETA